MKNRYHGNKNRYHGNDFSLPKMLVTIFRYLNDLGNVLEADGNDLQYSQNSRFTIQII